MDANGTISFVTSVYIQGTDQMITVPFVIYPTSLDIKFGKPLHLLESGPEFSQDNQVGVSMRSNPTDQTFSVPASEYSDAFR